MRSNWIWLGAALALCACHDARPADSPATTTSGAIASAPVPSQPRSVGPNAPLERSASDTQVADPDLKLVQDLRKAIEETNGLSLSAKTIFIDVSAGRITLRGQVVSEDERAQVVKAAKRFSADGQVNDQLTIAK
jgi:osmotically-inducible protein OsmY